MAGFPVRVFSLTAAAVGVVGAIALSADAAVAARPVKGALYADWFNDPEVQLHLRVSRSGRQLDPRRSVWADDPNHCAYSYLRLGTRRRPVRIKRDGTFRFVRRHGRSAFRVSGQFVTKDRAEAQVSYRFRPAHGARPRTCERRSLAPRRVGVRFRDCRTHEAKPLLETPAGRVFQQLKQLSSDLDHVGGWMPVAYACLYDANRLIKLGEDVDNGDPGGTTDLALFRLAGPYVAYGTFGGAEFARSFVGVHDLRSGKKREHFAGGFIGNLVLKDNGSTAWTASDGDARVPPTVWVWDSLGARRLDSGKIPDKSLTLDGSTLTWTNDGVERSATLY
jgi:hypothetical protein